MRKYYPYVFLALGVGIGLSIYLAQDLYCHRQFGFQKGFDPHHYKCCVIEAIKQK